MKCKPTSVIFSCLIASCLAMAIPKADPSAFCERRGEPCFKAKRTAAAFVDVYHGDDDAWKPIGSAVSVLRDQIDMLVRAIASSVSSLAVHNEASNPNGGFPEDSSNPISVADKAVRVAEAVLETTKPGTRDASLVSSTLPKEEEVEKGGQVTENVAKVPPPRRRAPNPNPFCFMRGESCTKARSV